MPEKSDAVRRTIAIALSLAIIGWLGPRTLRTVVPKPNAVQDFYQEWSSARSYWRGEPLYQDMRTLLHRDFGPQLSLENWILGRNVHPPTAILLALPFGLLPHRTAFLWWNVLGVCCIVATILLLVGLRRPVRWWRLLVLPALFLLSPQLKFQFLYGQLIPILLVLLTSAGLAYAANRRALAGSLVGLAAAIKVYPAVLAWIFLVRRDVRGLLGVAAGFGMATALTVGLLGASAYVDYVGVIPEAWEWRSTPTNSSIAGLWSKLFDPGPRGGCPIVPLRFDPWLAQVLNMLCAGILLAVWGWIASRSRDLRNREIAFATGCVAMLLLSPLTWELTVLLLLPALVVFWDSARRQSAVRLVVLICAIVLNVPLHGLASLALPEWRTHDSVNAIRLLGAPSLVLYGLLATFCLGSWLAFTTRRQFVCDAAGDRAENPNETNAPGTLEVASA